MAQASIMQPYEDKRKVLSYEKSISIGGSPSKVFRNVMLAHFRTNSH